MKHLKPAFIILILLGSNWVYSQQLPNWSSFYENGFLWNPALTARWNYWEVSVNQRKEWTGFENAPSYSSLGFQFPFLRRSTKVTMGAFAASDQVGPYSAKIFSGTYSYKIKTEWFGNKDDVLSLGILASARSFQYKTNSFTAFDGIDGDHVIADQQVSNLIKPDFAVGAFYNSVSDFYSFKSHYYFGLSVANLFPGKTIDINQGLVTNRIHAFAHGGYRYFPFRKRYYFEPGVFISYTFLRPVNIMTHLRFEQLDKYWLAAGIVSNGEAFAQAGVILTEDSYFKKILNGGVLRIGIKADYSFLRFRNYAGWGYEIYLGYLYDLE